MSPRKWPISSKKKTCLDFLLKTWNSNTKQIMYMKTISILSLLLFAVSCSTDKQTTTQEQEAQTSEILNSSLVDVLQTDTIKPTYLSKEYLMGKFDPSTREDFSLIEAKHTSKTGIYMRSDAYKAFSEMHAAAKKEGINLNIVSATRPFDYQKQIWEGKWNGK